MAERKLLPLPRGPCQSASEGRSRNCRANRSKSAVWPAHTAWIGILTPV